MDIKGYYYNNQCVAGSYFPPSGQNGLQTVIQDENGAVQLIAPPLWPQSIPLADNLQCQEPAPPTAEPENIWRQDLEALIISNDPFHNQYSLGRSIEAKEKLVLAGLDQGQAQALVLLINEKCGAGIINAIAGLPAAVAGLKRSGLSNAAIYALLEGTIKAVDCYTSNALIALPGLVDQGLSRENILAIFSEIRQSPLQSIGYTLQPLPDFFRAGITDGKTIVALVKVFDRLNSQSYQDSFAYLYFPKLLASLKIKDPVILERRLGQLSSLLTLGQGNLSSLITFLSLTDFQPPADSSKAALARALAAAIDQAVLAHAADPQKLRELCQTAAISLNTIHDNDPGDQIRKTACRTISPASAYFLIALGGADLYTSTFLKLWSNLEQGNILELISRVDPGSEQLGGFILTASNYNKFAALFDLDPDYFLNNIERLLAKEENLAGKVSVLTPALDTIFADGRYLDKVESLLVGLYEKYESAGKDRQRGAIGFLLKLYAAKWSPVGQRIADRLPAILSPAIPIEKYLADGAITAKLYFYEDERHYLLTIDDLRSRGFSLAQKGEKSWEMVETFNGKTLKVIITLDASTVEQDLHDEALDILVHRGHSYHLTDTFAPENQAAGLGKVLFLGSCGSFSHLADYFANYHGNYFITDENTAEGRVNNAALYHLMTSLARGVSDWGEIKMTSTLEEKGLIYPHDRSLLIIDYLQNFEQH